jgi:hypothetical protein
MVQRKMKMVRSFIILIHRLTKEIEHGTLDVQLLESKKQFSKRQIDQIAVSEKHHVVVSLSGN